ncbi:FHA domain-containing protein [Profundibacter sp.]
MLLVKIIGQSEGLLSLLPKAPAELAYILTFAVIFILYWLLVETVLGGRSIGRTLLGLHMCDAGGKPLGSARRMKRGLRKLTSLGLPGLQVSGLARYDKNSGCVWHSRMVPRPAGPIETWTLIIRTPAGKSRAVQMGQISGFRKTKSVKIGRDPNWADLVLPADSRASAKHCVLSVQNGSLKLADYNSSNGTVLGGKKLKPKTWVRLHGNEVIGIADIKIEVRY